MLEAVVNLYPEAERVDFVVEENDRVTDRIRDFHASMGPMLTALNRPDLVRLIGALIPGPKDRVSLQAADVFCWHVQRRQADKLDADDARRYSSLTSRSGFSHTWQDDELARFADAVIARLAAS